MLESISAYIPHSFDLQTGLSVLVFAAALGELYVNVLPDIKGLVSWCAVTSMSTLGKLQKFLSAITKILEDYSSGCYYLPWGRYDVVVLTGSQIDDHIRELADNPQLSQRPVYADIFDFQYNLHQNSTSFDPEEQTPHRYRLFGNVIRSIGCSQLAELAPFLHAAASKACHLTIDSSPQDDQGWHDVKLASLMRQCSTDLDIPLGKHGSDAGWFRIPFVYLDSYLVSYL